MTAYVGIIDPALLQLTYVTAGHPAPLLVEDDGSLETLPGIAPALGILPDWSGKEFTTTLSASSALVLYTDGLIEFTRNVERGEARLHGQLALWMQAGRPGGVAGLVRSIFGPHARTDDTVVLVATFPAPAALDLTLAAVPTRVADFRRALHRFAVARGLANEELFALLVAAGEAINNAVTHAYEGEDGQVRLRATAEDGSLRIEIHDGGRWHSSEHVADPAAEHGRGIELMRALADGVEIDHDAEGTHVRLRFARTSRMPAAASA